MPARLLPSVIVAIALWWGTAGRAAAETLVMVSPPAELDAAVRASLAPWRVKIIAIEMASGTPAELALTLGAGFVVWRDRDQLVLWNAGGGVGERRDIPPALDDAGAAALALSIKTWMNLGAPPPPDGAPGEPPLGHEADPEPGGRPTAGPVVRVIAPARVLPPAPLLRLDAASGVRANIGAHGRTEVRVALAAAGRVGPVETVLGVELGPAHPVSAEQGTGELSALVMSAHARLPFVLSPSLVAAPAIGVVLQRAGFSGVDTVQRAFSSTSWKAGADVAGVLEWRRGRILAGVELGASALPSAQFRARNVKMTTPAHIETRGLARIGLVLR